jgi:hypothetical protein
MSIEIPPNPYFSGINYNPSFFSKLSDYLTEAIANSKYLRLIGGILSGNLGIKRTPAVELDVNGKVNINNNIFANPSNGVYGGDGTRLILAPGTISTPPYAFGIAPTTLWYGAPEGANHIFYSGTNERLRIKGDGNVGIGTSDPNSRLELYSTSQLTSRIILSGQEFYEPSNTSSSGVALLCGVNRTGNRQMWIGDSARLTQNSTNPVLRLLTNSIDSIATDGQTPLNISIGNALTTTSLFGAPVLINSTSGGNVGISTNTANNIFQVGNGGRLRISNGASDFTLIGTKETNDNNNTRIGLSGYTRGSGNAGNIEYIATTATGKHKFYINATTTLADWDVDDCRFYNSITTIGANYFTDGEYIPHSPKTNTAGVLKNGYFIYTGYFFNSFINIALSHNDSTYSYWHGHIGTNNDTAPMYITATAQNNATIESFQEQTTNIYWIYFRPSSSYNASVQLRVKFYG